MSLLKSAYATINSRIVFCIEHEFPLVYIYYADKSSTFEKDFLYNEKYIKIAGVR